MARDVQLKNGMRQASKQAPRTRVLEKTAEPPTFVAPSRRGKIAVTAFYDPDVRMQLKILAAERKTSIQELVTEALNGLFERYGKPPIAA
ncbi:MAG TPA: ribbon-helix-helix domain-containing protein [Bryobacteraceae bacterium]|jgi:hypothetical protein|nr:ribbon-helix-helix domain-containing protein [Bryobacteraceae bacterium]